MRIIETPHEMQAWAREARSTRGSIGFVPTMGALHAGHSHLVSTAMSQCDAVVVSIFINSLQFNEADDFEKYPRTFETDIDMCTSSGVDVVYAPGATAMYPEGFDTSVAPGPIADLLEGTGRPGHFTGVTTVVTKLFNAVQPTHAFFGRKDFQQLAIISKMVRDLDFPITIVPVDTVRDGDGLALSSRNRRLSPDDRRAAVVLYKSLTEARTRFARGENSARNLIDHVTKIITAEPCARLEYVDVVDSDTCVPVDLATSDSTIVLAAWFGDVRLIDNISLHA